MATEDGLNARMLAFVEHYCSDEGLSATQAAINAGYSSKGAGSQAHRLLKNVNVIRAVKDRRDSLSEKNLADRAWKRRKLVQVVEAGLREVENIKTGICAPANLNAAVGALSELAKIDGEIIKRSEIKADVKQSRSREELEDFLVSFGIDPTKIIERDRRPVLKHNGNNGHVHSIEAETVTE